jgi:O-antigen ligase
MEIWIYLALILFSLIAIFRLKWALFFVLAALPTYLIRLSFWQLPSTFLEMLILIVFLVWFFQDKPWRRFKKHHWQKRREKYPYYLEIIGILMAAWLGLVVAGFSLSSLGIFRAYFLEPIMLYIVLINRGQGALRKFIWPLVFSSLLIAGVSIWQQLIDRSFFEIVSSSIFLYPNAVGLYLGPIIILLIGLLFSYPKKTNLFLASKKILIILTALLSFLAILLARSDGAIIAVLVSLFFIAFLANSKLRKISIISLILLTILLSFYQPGQEYLKNRIALKDLSGQIRRQQWKETKDMLFDGRWLFGSGLSNYQKVVSPYHQEGIFVKDFNDPDWHRKVVWNEDYRKSVWQPVEIYLYPHNILLNFWTEITLFGALLFLWLILKIIFDLIKLLKRLSPSQKSLALGTIGAMLVVLIHGLVDVPYFKNDLAVLFWLLVALTALLKLKNKKI